MSGLTVSDAAPESLPEAAELARVLGVQPTPHRSHYSVYPHPKPSVGASGVVLYEEAATGEPVMLLVRRKKDAGQWTYPAGYMELLPEGDRIVADRVSANTRHLLEEQTEGGLAAHAVPPPLRDSGPAPAILSVPPGRQVRNELDGEFRRLLIERGWEAANTLMNDAGHVRRALARAGMELPEGVDVTIGENLVREVGEETGLDLSAYPDARPRFVRMDTSLAYSSGGQRNYTANPHFLVDLGRRAAPPPLGSRQGEIVDVAWVPVRDVSNQGGGNHYVVRGPAGGEDLPLDPYTVPVIQETLHQWLSAKIGELTLQEYASARSIWAALRAGRGTGGEFGVAGTGIEGAADRILSEEPSQSGMLANLTGPKGVERLRDYRVAAAALAGCPRRLGRRGRL